jgi:hypothetical protein
MFPSDAHHEWISPKGEVIRTNEHFSSGIRNHLDGFDELLKMWERRGLDVTDETVDTALERRWVMLRHDRITNSLYLVAKKKLTRETIEVLRRLLLTGTHGVLFWEGPEDKRPLRAKGPRELLDMIYRDRL